MREYFLQEVQVFNEEIGEQVVVKGDATAEPAEGVVVRRQIFQATGAENAVEDGVKPQGDEMRGSLAGRPGVFTRERMRSYKRERSSPSTKRQTARAGWSDSMS